MSAGLACLFRMMIMINQKTIAAIGKFDGFHVGHMKLLNTAIETAKKQAVSLSYFS